MCSVVLTSCLDTLRLPLSRACSRLLVTMIDMFIIPVFLIALMLHASAYFMHSLPVRTNMLGIELATHFPMSYHPRWKLSYMSSVRGIRRLCTHQHHPACGC